jgi:hypothetical protein
MVRWWVLVHCGVQRVNNPRLIQTTILLLDQRTRGVSHYGLAIYIKKYLKAKEEELWKLKYFMMQKYNLQKKSSKKETKILQDIITLYLISSFTTSQHIIFQKSSYKNAPVIT